MPKTPFSVKGMKVDDVMKMSVNAFNQLSIKEQKTLVSRLVSAGNKRLRTFDKYGEASSAVTQLRATGDKYLSVKGRNTPEALREEFERARKFMRQAVSKRSEYNKVIKKVQQGLKKKGVLDATREQVKKIMEAMDQLALDNPDVTKRAYKYKVVQKIGEAYIDPNNKKSTSEIFADIQDEILRQESDIHASEYVGEVSDHDAGFASYFRDIEDF